jgi:hypothetical protein
MRQKRKGDKVEERMRERKEELKRKGKGERE